MLNFFVVPVPENVQIQNITTSSVIVSYELSNKTQPYTKIEVLLINRESKEFFEFSTKAMVPTGKIPLNELISGTQYAIKMRMIFPDGLKSKNRTEKDFQTGKFIFLSTFENKD